MTSPQITVSIKKNKVSLGIIHKVKEVIAANPVEYASLQQFVLISLKNELDRFHKHKVKE